MPTTNYPDPLKWRPGWRVRFRTPSSEARFWWTVRQTDGLQYVILTRQAPFSPKGEMVYTIIDTVRGVRGPCNLIGNGWDLDDDPTCEKLLRALHRYHEIAAIVRAQGSYTYDGEDDINVEVSHRNNVPIEIRDVTP